MKYFHISFLILVISCQNSGHGKQAEAEEIKFFDEKLDLNSNKPVLKIYCQFEECGEWGGHKEYLIVSKRDNKLYRLNYEKYRVDCDSLVPVDGHKYAVQPKNDLIESKEIEITEKEKKAILEFSFEMVKSKFKEEFPGQAGLVLLITNSDSTFMIRTYGGNANHYLKLLSELKLKE